MMAVVGSSRSKQGAGSFVPGADSDSDGEELMDLVSGRDEGFAPLRISSSTDELDVALASRDLTAPGPCFGRHLLKMAPSHEKTVDRRTLKDNCLYFMCIPIWARTGAAFAVGMTFLLFAFFSGRIERTFNQIGIGNYYSLDPTAGGLADWRESRSDPSLGNLSACVSPGGEFRVVYLYNITNPDEVKTAMASSDEPAVQPVIQEVGPYYYAVTWNYTDLEWSTDRVLLNYTVNEDLVFCPGSVIPWNDARTSDGENINNIGLGYQSARYSGNTAIEFGPDDYVVTRPARDWVMGYVDEKLRDADGVRNPRVTPLQHNMSIPTQTDWASQTGLLSSNQTLQIWTGVSRSLGFAGYMSRVQNTANAQVCHSFVDSGTDPLCEDAWPCPEQMDCPDVEPRPETSPEQAEGSQLGYINGSTGQRFPWQPDFSTLAPEPLNCQHNLSLWLPALLRTVALYCDPSEGFDEVTTMATARESTDDVESDVAVTSRRFRIAPEDAMPSTERPFNAGYDMLGSPWVWNLTAQRQAPVFMSLPHFANSTYEINATTGMTASNVVGVGTPDEFSLSWLSIEINSGVRLRGALRLQTNVLVTGSAGGWSAPWMVPIGHVSYEHNASDSVIRTIHEQAYGSLAPVAAKVATISFLVTATLFLTMSIQTGVKYYQMERGLVKMKSKRLARSGAAMGFVRRTCLRCGLCGPERSDIGKRLQEMKQEELLSPLLASGHSITPRISIQESDHSAGAPTGRRRAATDDHGIEVHFGKLEQMSSDESDEGEGIQDEHTHVVTQLDLDMWDDLVAPPGRSRLQRCYMVWELSPWICWWVVGIVPRWMLRGVPHLVSYNWRPLETRALVLAAILSALVVASQMVQKLCTPKKDRVFVLVPTIIDLSTLLMFSVSAVIAGIGGLQESRWEPWPAITHGSMLMIGVLCMACDHPFILPVYCRELRPEIWRERIILRLCEVVSWTWCMILALITVLQTIPVIATRMPSGEQGFLYAWIPAMLLVMTFWFTIWYSMQVEEEFVRALNRLLRKGELRSKRLDTAGEQVMPTPTLPHAGTPHHLGADPPTEDEADLRIVPTLSPRNGLNTAEAGTQRSRPVPLRIAADGTLDRVANVQSPEPTCEHSVEASGPADAPVLDADHTSTSIPTQAMDASVEVQAGSVQLEGERPRTAAVQNPDVGIDHDRDERVTAGMSDNSGVEHKTKEIQEFVAAALAKSSTISAQLHTATSVEAESPVGNRVDRRGSVSSISSDEFHDAESGEDRSESD